MEGSEYQAETTWFHIFRHMIESGDMAKMGGSTFMVYSTIKAYANWSTGHSFPKIEIIAEKTALSERQVMRSLKTLEEMGYIKKEKQWKTNIYTLREKVTISNSDGRPAAEATWDYLPNSVKAAQAELKNFLMTGDTANAKIVHIEHLTFNFNTQNISEGSTGIQVNSDKYPNVKELVERVEASRAKASGKGKA